MQGNTPQRDLSPDMKVRTELLVEEIDRSRGGSGDLIGQHTFEFVFQDGELLRWFRHEGPVPAGALGRFEQPA